MSGDPAGTGYLSPDYVAALGEFGAPRPLPRSGGWILERPVAGTHLRDAMGPYPLLACRDWTPLVADLDEIGGELVSLVGVTDPFGNYDEESLRRAFPDLILPFKDHFVVGLGPPPESFVASHHQRNARKALAQVDVVVASPGDADEAWVSLYSNLIARHSIQGIAAFSPASLRAQLKVPGATLFCAMKDDEMVGATLWYRQGQTAYYHLGAYSQDGYALKASFALFWRMLEHFTAAGLAALDLGGGAGLRQDEEDGLTRFKRGWSTGTRKAWLVGRIFDHEAYAALTRGRSTGEASYFPAYRSEEPR
jgi:hypothetical protein